MYYGISCYFIFQVRLDGLITWSDGLMNKQLRKTGVECVRIGMRIFVD